MDKRIHLIKLCVGAESVEDLLAWQAQPRAMGPTGLPRHITRMWPKRADDVLNGGSMFWVFKGVVLCRQPIASFDAYESPDGITRCAISFQPEVIRVAPTPKRPFQGWRYLQPGDAPIDLTAGQKRDDALPPTLQVALAEIGVL